MNLKLPILSKIYFFKILLIIFSIPIIFFSFVNFTKAATAESFTHTVKASYEVKQDRGAKVTYSFVTTNKTTNYLQTFSFRLPFQLKNVSVEGSPTPIRVKELRQSNTANNRLTIEIINPIHGLNQKFEWKFSFEIENIVIPHAMQDAIILTTFNDDPSIVSFEMTVRVPVSFGQIRYLYGEGEYALESDEYTKVTFKDGGNQPTNFVILLGGDQEYFFEANATKKVDINLPLENKYQSVFYTQFPSRNINKGDQLNRNTISINDKETIKAFIIPSDKYDDQYQGSFDQITNQSLIDSLVSQLPQQETSYLKANEAFKLLRAKFNLSDFLTNFDTRVDISSEKNNFNPAELNEIYRQILTKLGIENRGAYGYVFPIQPFAREEYKTSQHIWTEFWDGSKWIVVDPTWYITSEGGDYFDKNAFHHVKFGNYQNIEDINNFLISNEFIKVVPLTTPSKEILTNDIKFSAETSVNLNKEFQIKITNNSNQFIKLTEIIPDSKIEKVKLSNKIDANTTLYPNSSVNLNIPLEYGLIVKDKEGTIRLNVKYEGNDSQINEKDFSHVIKVPSNISNYLSTIIVSGIMIFLIISVVSFVLYKKF